MCGCTISVCASQLLSAGVDGRTVAGWLGHRNAATTLNVYAHFFEQSDRAAADIIGRLIADEPDRRTNALDDHDELSDDAAMSIAIEEAAARRRRRAQDTTGEESSLRQRTTGPQRSGDDPT